MYDANYRLENRVRSDVSKERKKRKMEDPWKQFLEDLGLVPVSFIQGKGSHEEGFMGINIATKCKVLLKKYCFQFFKFTGSKTKKII